MGNNHPGFGFLVCVFLPNSVGMKSAYHFDLPKQQSPDPTLQPCLDPRGASGWVL